MRRLLFFGYLFLSLLLAKSLCGAPIDLQRAQELAQQQLQSVQPLRGEGYTLALSYTSSGVPVRGDVSVKDYYIFDVKGRDGFVIVAGDDNLGQSIIGYSLENKFQVEGMPAHIKNWLDIKAAWVQKARLRGTGKPGELLDVYKNKTMPIAPIINDIKWDQEDPYNMLTPQNAPTGCLATAMAQVMRYHCWPIESRGKIRYTDISGRFRKYDFGHKFDWKNMTNLYNARSTDEERAAVALLMVECGYAAQMRWTPYGSGAYLSNAFLGLRKYFDYGPRLKYVQQIHYTIEEWVDIIMKELSEGRPVLYGGAAFGVGHAFVCDGYDGKGLFHFNWGWSGLSNGWYSLSDMLPRSQSTGGGGEGGYNMTADIIIGWEPMPKSTVAEEDPNISVYELMTNTSATYSKNTVLEGESALKLRGLANYGYDVVEFRPGLRLVDNKGKEVKIFWATDEEIQNMEGGTFSSRRVPIPTIYSDIPNGIYQMEVVYKVSGEETIRKMPIMPRYGKNMVTISDDKVNFSTTENTPRLELTWKTPVLRKDSYNYVDFEIKNVGNTAYTSVFGAGWSDKKTTTERPSSTQFFVFVQSLRLEVGETQVFHELLPTFPEEIDANYLHFYWDSSNGTSQDLMLEVGGRYYPIEPFAVAEFKKKPAYNYSEDYKAELENVPSEVVQGDFLEFDIKIGNEEKNMGVDTGLKVLFFNDNSIDTIASHRLGTCYLPPNHTETFHVRYPVTWAPRDGYSFHVVYQVVELEADPENPGKTKKVYQYIDFEPELVGRFKVTKPESSAMPVPNYGTTGIEEAKALEAFVASPNPFRDVLRILAPDSYNLQGTCYELVSAQGIVVRKGQLRDRETLLNTKGLPAGLYMLRLATKTGEQRTHRVVKY